MINVNNRPRSSFIVSFILVSIILTAYWKLPTHDFLGFDDTGYITQNIHVNNGITWKSVAWAFSFPSFGYWHPLTWLSHMLDCHIFGLKPGMHHLTNLLLHIGNTLLLFLVLKKMTGSIWKSAFVAAIFALHPLNVESVAWASERKNVLSTFFWMLTTLTYIRYVETPNFYRYLLILIVFILGLMAKPMIVTLPFVFFLLDYWPLGRLKFNLSSIERHEESHKPENNGFQHSPIFRLILEKTPLIALSAVAIYFSSLSVKRLVISTVSVPMKVRIANALVSYVSYIKKMIWPHDLAVFYPYPQTLPLWQVAGSGLLLLCISFLVLRALKSKPYLSVGWLWYIGTLFPAIGLVQAGLWPAMADRFMYVPLIGLFIVIAWGIPDLLPRWHSKEIVLGTLSAGLVLILLATTWLQVRHWENGVKLFTYVLKVTRGNSVAHFELGHALDQHGKYNEAMIHYIKALKINPNYVQAHNNLGYALARQGKYKDAIYHYDEALSINPNDVKTHNNLGIVLARKGNFKDAVYHYNEALRSNPNYVRAYYNLGKIYANQGNIEDAIHYYRKALVVNPNMTQALYNISWIFATLENDKFRNGEEAIELAEKLCKITQYNQPLALDALAAAYAETGNFELAVLTAQKALKLAEHQGPEELAFGLRKRLELYMKRQPYRQKLNNENES